MEPDAMWRLYSGVNFPANSLSRTALKLERVQLSVQDRNLVNPGIQDLYSTVAEASKLLPLFHTYADTLAVGPVDAPATGFQSLPTEVQRTILELAAADSATAAALRRVSRSFEAHAWIDMRSRTAIDVFPAGTAGSLPLTLLPYLPRLATIDCNMSLNPPATRFVDSVMTAQLPAWPDLVSLKIALDNYHVPLFPQQLSAASRLTCLCLDRAFQGSLMPIGDWPHALARALPHLRNLHTLRLLCPVPSGCPEPRLCDHLSALTQLTHLHYEASTNDADGTIALTRALNALTKLRRLQLDRWPSSASAADRSAWLALMSSLCSLRGLDTLHLGRWQLDGGCSAAYFPSLGPALASLRALTLSADNNAPQTVRNAAAAAAADAKAAAALVHAIGSLTQLQALRISGVAHVGLCTCCQHLGSLTNLTDLQLWWLDSVEPTAPDALEAHPAARLTAGRTLEQLLVGMTRLDSLVLDSVGLSGRSAMRFFEHGLPTMLHLECLLVNDNHMGLVPAMMLAHAVRQLPALVEVLLSEGNDLPEEEGDVPGSLADMNSIAGRHVFF